MNFSVKFAWKLVEMATSVKTLEISNDIAIGKKIAELKKKILLAGKFPSILFCQTRTT